VKPARTNLPRRISYHHPVPIGESIGIGIGIGVEIEIAILVAKDVV
jgi:hypothetical protein